MIIGTQLVKKVRRMVDTYAHLIFEQVRVLPAQAQETREHLRAVPDSQAGWRDVEPGFVWGKAWESAWFRSRLDIDESLAGLPLYLRASTGALEALLWVNGEPRGIYNHPVEAPALGGHHTLLLTGPQSGGTVIEIALESYAGHPIPGTQPFALEGCPKAAHTTVSKFMAELEATSRHVPAYHGELYFEGHRGSLTQMAAIKRSNRKAELALRDAEFFATLAELGHLPSPRADIAALYDTLLINQFHDILPGTSIPEVHTRAIRELSEVVAGAESACTRLLGSPDTNTVTVWNTLSWERRGILTLPDPGEGLVPADDSLRSQRVTDLQTQSLLLIDGWQVPALSGHPLSLTHGATTSGSVFRWSEPILETPLLRVEFDEAGFIRSLVDRKVRREICTDGLPLNTLLCGEDVPESWDNWNIDEDQRRKLLPQRRLISREVVADGMLQFRLRSIYQIGKRSTLRQDMVFFADSTRIEFETEVDWQERHQLLKVAFPVNIAASSARHEIQFGHIERTSRPRNSYEQSMFEVCNHKWSDVSESRYGIALLNDCKYGISVEGAEMRLTLLKSGCLPDPRADNGIHRFTYALAPHEGGFCADSVVRPAYELNVPLRIGSPINKIAPPLLEIEDSNIIVEAVKPAEDGNGFIVRLYECERTSGKTGIRFSPTPSRVIRTNMLEEAIETLPSEDGALSLTYRAFEIITLRILMDNYPESLHH